MQCWPLISGLVVIILPWSSCLRNVPVCRILISNLFEIYMKWKLESLMFLLKSLYLVYSFFILVRNNYGSKENPCYFALCLYHIMIRIFSFSFLLLLSFHLVLHVNTSLWLSSLHCLTRFTVLLLLLLTGTAGTSEHLQHLHGAGDSLLLADGAAVPCHPGSLQAPPAWHRSLHDLWEHQSPAGGPLPSFSPHEHLPHGAK